jgi:MFS family permease
MQFTRPLSTWKDKIFTIYILAFLFTIHGALPTYIESTYLTGFTSEATVGFLYVAASIVAIIIFAFIPHILERYGNYHTTLALLALELVSYLGMASGFGVASIISFIMSFICIAVINFNMDIFLQNTWDPHAIGRTRGNFLTFGNVAWVLAPFLGWFILTGDAYWHVFLAGALILLPVIFILSSNLGDFRDPQYIKVPYFRTLRDIWRNKDILSVFICYFILQFFYAWMTVYMPLYLFNHIGFSWPAINVIFTIMLVPFLVIEFPLGRLADSGLGEKELMSIGFIILAFTTGIISFINGSDFLTWALVLFATRVGAAMVEVMSETYFYKKVASADINTVSVFRTIRPWSYIIAPIIAFMVLDLFKVELGYIFVILGLIMFYGLRHSLVLKDIK